jgi:hypothetical protein
MKEEILMPKGITLATPTFNEDTTA